MHALRYFPLAGLLLAALSTSAAPANAPPCDAAAPVHQVADLLAQRYARADVAQRYAQALRQHAAAGRYCRAKDGEQLAAWLTTDLQAVHADRHLRVRHSAQPLQPDEGPSAEAPPSAEDQARFRREQLRQNVGFEQVQVLNGNVGLLRMSYFGDPSLGAAKLHAAMAFLADTDALVIDLRGNLGATDPELLELLTRYLVRDSAYVVATVHWRDDRPDAMKTPASLPVTGARYLDRPVVLLTSGSTFSGAEGFAYNLQAMKRAEVVGERTGGGANPGREFRASHHLAVWVPLGITKHPVTGSSWEGTGVLPDREVPAQQALPAALAALYERLLAVADADPAWQGVLKTERANALRELARPDTRPDVRLVLPGFSSAREVAVVGSFNQWSPRANPMRRVGRQWQVRLRAEPGRHTYKFWVDGEWLLDPTHRRTETDRHGNTNSLLDVRAR